MVNLNDEALNPCVFFHGSTLLWGSHFVSHLWIPSLHPPNFINHCCFNKEGILLCFPIGGFSCLGQIHLSDEIFLGGGRGENFVSLVNFAASQNLLGSYLTRQVI
ncbi:hypothetical protein Bca4012_060029 [Brassica carinata]